MNFTRVFSFACTAAFAVSAAHAQITPGLTEYRYGGRSIAWGTPWMPEGGLPTSSRVVPGPYAANAWGADNSGFDVNYTVPGIWPPEGEAFNGSVNGGWGNDMTFYYTGYIYVPEGSNKVCFAASFDDAKRLEIDGVLLFNNAAWDNTQMETVTLSTGWHKFDLWLDNGTGGFGPYNWPFGFGIDWLGRDTWDSNNYVFPANTPDNVIFSATEPADRVLVSTGAAKDIGSTSAVIPCELQITAANAGALILYYGETDCEVDADAWGLETLPLAAPVSGDYEFALTGLDFGAVCHYRPAFVSHLGVTNFASQTRFFTTGVTVLGSPVYRHDDALVFTVTLPNGTPEPGTVSVFCDTEDRSESGDWALRYDYVGDIGVGDHAIRVDSLSAGQTYAYRYAFISAAGYTNYADHVASFVNDNVDVPCDFAWRDSATGDIAFGNPSAWDNLQSLPRTTPGTVVGDTISMRTGANRGVTFWLEEDASLAGIYAGNYDWQNDNWHTFITSVGATLRLETGDAEAPFLLDLLELGGMTFDGSLTLNVPQPAVFRKSHAHNSHLILGSPITGTPGALRFEATANVYTKLHVYPQNTGSDFVGDLHAAAYNGAEVRLYCGFNRWGTRAYADDTFFGDPANAVHLETFGTSLTIYKSGSATAPREFILNRPVHGIGTVKCVDMDSYHNTWGDWPYPLDIGPDATFYPGTETDFGTLEFWTNDLTIDRDAAFICRIDKDGEASDGVRFTLRTASINHDSNSSGATINLGGRVTIVPPADARYIRPGLEWVVATIVPADTTVNGALTGATTGYRIHPPALNAAGDAWIVVAEKLPESTLLFVR